MRYELMRPSQIREAINKRTPVVLPLGVLEYHSEHLPVGMDTLAVERALWEYEKEAEIVILPAFWWGASSRAVAPCEGRGSIPVDSQALVPIARQIFRGLLDVGFRNIHTFVHHQSEDYAAGMPTDLAFRLASRQVIMEFLEEKKGNGWWGDPSSASYYTDHTNLDANPFIWIQNHALMDAKVLAKYPFDHAGEGETSLMMSLCPDTVDMGEFDKTAWYAQSALKASKETGDGGVAMILDHFRRPEIVTCHFHKPDRKGWAKVSQNFPDGTGSVYVRYRPCELPYATRWIARTADEDALGMCLPATAEHKGLAYCRAHGQQRVLEPGEHVMFHVVTGLETP